MTLQAADRITTDQLRPLLLDLLVALQPDGPPPSPRRLARDHDRLCAGVVALVGLLQHPSADVYTLIVDLPRSDAQQLRDAAYALAEAVDDALTA